MHYIVSSYGNDSVALIQYLYESGLRGATVIHNVTGWQSDTWPKRVDQCEAWANSLGYNTLKTFRDLSEETLKRKMFPSGRAQWCTIYSKVQPTIDLLSELDPEAEAVICVGKRRAESKKRSLTMQWELGSLLHGGRDVFNPLYMHTDDMRNELISKTPIPILPHKSDECWPCIYANKKDLKRLSQDKQRIMDRMRLEETLPRQNRLGPLYTTERPMRTMFTIAGRAVRVDEKVAWAIRDDAASDEHSISDECDGGYCGG